MLTPSNAAVRVCEDPEPTEDKLITVLLFAFYKLVANLTVFAESNEI